MSHCSPRSEVPQGPSALAGRQALRFIRRLVLDSLRSAFTTGGKARLTRRSLPPPDCKHLTDNRVPCVSSHTRRRDAVSPPRCPGPRSTAWSSPCPGAHGPPVRVLVFGFLNERPAQSLAGAPTHMLRLDLSGQFSAERCRPRPERSQFSILSTKRRDDDEPSVIHFCAELHADASPKKTRGHRASTFQRCLKPEMNQGNSLSFFSAWNRRAYVKNFDMCLILEARSSCLSPVL